MRAYQAALSDPRRFTQATRSADPEATIPASELLTGLRGKDVLIVFVESYGQVAVRGSSSPRASTPFCASRTAC